MEVLIRINLGLLIIIPGALIVHLCQTSTLLTLLKVQLRSEAWSIPSDAMSATERYEDDIQKATELYKIAKQNGSMEATRAMLGAGIGSGILPDGNPLGLHLVMFIPTLMGQVQTLWRAGGYFVSVD